MYKRSLALCLSLLTPLALSANTELFHQPNKGEFATDFGVKLDVGEIKTKEILGNNTRETTTYSAQASAGVQYGLFQNFSLESRLKISTQDREVSNSNSTEIDTERSGINDFEVGIKGFIEGSKSYDILYGARYLFSFNDRKVEANGDHNKFSGGDSAFAYLGFLLKADEWRFGTFYDQNVWNEKKTYVTPISNSKIDYIKSGTFALFGEYHHEEFKIGTILEFTNNGRFSDEYDTASDLFSFEAYGAFIVGDGVELIGQLRNTLIMEEYYNGRELEEGFMSSVQGSCRITF